jgi:type II secretory pathway pseudopilin PulG
MRATACTPCSSRAGGFTLVELAVVLVVSLMLVASLLAPLATQVEERQVSDTEKALDEIKEVLMVFATVNGYLPCPDKNAGVGGAGTANDGIEDVDAAGACVATNQGNLPWVTLGVGASDVWGNRYRYQVSPAFAQRAPGSVFSLASPGTIGVCSTAACPTATRHTLPSPEGAAAIVISLGRNGYSAINAATGNVNPLPTSADELENESGPSQFVSRTRTAAGSTAGEFDDIVVWISKYALFNRMVATGRLP